MAATAGHSQCRNGIRGNRFWCLPPIPFSNTPSSMLDDDRDRSTDLADVFRSAFATPILRPLAVWMASVAGTAACLLIPVVLWEIDFMHSWDDFWLVVLGAPLTLIGGVMAGVDGSWLWVRNAEFSRPSSQLEPWEYSAIRVWTLRLLLVPAVLLWFRAAVRVCRGRWIATSLCHLFAASFLMNSGRLEERWWVAVFLTVVMVVAFWRMKAFRHWRTAEAEFEQGDT